MNDDPSRIFFCLLLAACLAYAVVKTVRWKVEDTVPMELKEALKAAVEAGYDVEHKGVHCYRRQTSKNDGNFVVLKFGGAGHGGISYDKEFASADDALAAMFELNGGEPKAAAAP